MILLFLLPWRINLSYPVCSKNTAFLFADLINWLQAEERAAARVANLLNDRGITLSGAHTKGRYGALYSSKYPAHKVV